MALITAYLDDSGTDPANPVACTSGFISPLGQWKKFHKEWDDARSIRGDEFDCMHMAECVSSNPKSEFCNWDLKKKQRVLKRLRSLIKSRATKGIGMAVSKRHYEEYVPEEVKRKVGSNFSFSVLQTMSMVGRWRRVQSIADPIEYVFDWMEPKDPKRKQLEELFESECSHGSALHDYGLVSGGYSFRHKEELPPLQAADMAAWTLYSAIQHALGIKQVSQLAGESYSDFEGYRKESRWFDGGFQTEAQLHNFVSQLPPSPEFAKRKELRVRKKKRR